MTEENDLISISGSYLSLFFLDINNLKDSLTGYRSIMLRLAENKNPETGKTSTNPDDKMKNAVILWSDSIRGNVERCHISAVALSESTFMMNIADRSSKKEGTEETEKPDTLETLYEKIISQFSPDLKDVSEYVFEINKLFVKNTIDKILNKMETFYDQFTTKK